jgi:hypothetical protein
LAEFCKFCNRYAKELKFKIICNFRLLAFIAQALKPAATAKMSEFRAKGVSVSANRHRSLKIEDRIFIVYRPEGLNKAYGPHMVVAGKVLPGHIPHIKTDIPGCGK